MPKADPSQVFLDFVRRLDEAVAPLILISEGDEDAQRAKDLAKGFLKNRKFNTISDKELLIISDDAFEELKDQTDLLLAFGLSRQPNKINSMILDMKNSGTRVIGISSQGSPILKRLDGYAIMSLPGFLRRAVREVTNRNEATI